MASTAGVGHSVNPASFDAGVEAARSALDEAGTGSAQLGLLFHTAKHDPAQFHAGARSVLGAGARLVGGFAGGIITRSYLGYDGYQGAVAALSSTSVRFHTFVERRLSERGERSVGLALGRQIRSRRYMGEPGLIYMYDSIKRFSPVGGFDMNIGTYLIEGLGSGLGEWPEAAGMGIIGNMQMNPTFQFFDDEILQQAAIGLVVDGGSFRLDTTIMHGCKPASSYHTVTKSDTNVVLEIDGRPALDVIAELLGPDATVGWREYPLFVTLGVNKGDKFGEYDEEAYANRLCMAIDEKRRGLIMFEPDLEPGTDVQLMRRSIDFAYIHERARRLYEDLGDREPFFALYIDCMGRAGAYCGSEGEEGAEIQSVIGSRMPFLGMYTGVELGMVAGRQQALDWSGVLCILSE